MNNSIKKLEGDMNRHPKTKYEQPIEILKCFFITMRKIQVKNKIPDHTSKNGLYLKKPKYTKQKAGILRISNSYSLLVGM